jgi:hypothetical protein
MDMRGGGGMLLVVTPVSVSRAAVREGICPLWMISAMVPQIRERI